MKVSTNMSKNFFSCFDESKGISLQKQKLLKSNSYRFCSYMRKKLLILIFLFLLATILLLFSCCYMPIILLSWIISFIGLGYFIYFLTTVMTSYHYRKNQQFQNTILIDKNGITDESYYGIKMIFSWNKILGIVVGKRTIVILTDTPVYFYFDLSKKDEILTSVHKYGDEIKIIY